jgi:hypothetical protein
MGQPIEQDGKKSKRFDTTFSADEDGEEDTTRTVEQVIQRNEAIDACPTCTPPTFHYPTGSRQDMFTTMEGMLFQPDRVIDVKMLDQALTMNRWTLLGESLEIQPQYTLHDHHGSVPNNHWHDMSQHHRIDHIVQVIDEALAISTEVINHRSRKLS